MKKLNELLEEKKVQVVGGFKAVQDLNGKSTGSEEVVLSTLPASILLEAGIEEYYAINFERGMVFNTVEELIEANPTVTKYGAKFVSEQNEDILIVSRHEGTVEILKEMYPNAEINSANVTKEDLKGKHVVGTLPPFLITSTGLYTPVTIENFDYSKDGDIKGNELKDRLIIGKSFQLTQLG